VRADMALSFLERWILMATCKNKMGVSNNKIVGCRKFRGLGVICKANKNRRNQLVLKSRYSRKIHPD
jgi:hypothetical protein